MEAILARQTLERMKRGVPPVTSLNQLSVGMYKLEAALQALLSPDADPRWFLVQNEYGEGKSHFHSYAREYALRAGFAVASLDVDGQEGALHHTQRHLASVLDSLRSPLKQFSGYQGFANIVRHWFETTDESNAVTIFQKLMAVRPWVYAGRDPDDMRHWSHYFIDPICRESMRYWYYPRLIRFFSCEDLRNKGTYARFAASFRLQVILQWLAETGHRGLLLYIDEVDNVVRQISTRAHPGCFRSLAWYCSSPAFKNIRVIFAATPEVVRNLDTWARDEYLRLLRNQTTVREEETKVYERWNMEAQRLSAKGWHSCPRLDDRLKKEVFQRIARLHRNAWNWSCESDGIIDYMARKREFSTMRRWVRACVQLLDTLQQADR